MRKYQYYDTGEDGESDAYLNNWIAQTFTVETVHMISRVKLKLFRTGDPGTIRVSIKATSSGKPTGADLCFGTIEGTDITESSPGEWYEITLGAGYIFEASTMYSIVVRAVDGDESNKVSARKDGVDATYSGGTLCTSSDSGVDWGIISGSDLMFEEWGAGEPAPTATVWGLLPKSQIDAELVEEAIARMIGDHNENETAHLETGQSLQSHKASEIIDHVIASIIADKIKDFEIPDVKFSDDRFLYSTIFVDFDKWTISDYLGGGVSGGAGRVIAEAGDTVGSYGTLYLESATEGEGVNFERSPKFVVGAKFGSTLKGEFYLVAGAPGLAGFGFKISAGTLYANHAHGEVEYNTEITDSVTLTERNRFLAILYSGEKIEYYINGVLVATHTENLPDTDDDDAIAEFCQFKTKCIESGYPIMYIYYHKFSQLIDIE